mgnify:FL=1
MDFIENDREARWGSGGLFGAGDGLGNRSVWGRFDRRATRWVLRKIDGRFAKFEKSSEFVKKNHCAAEQDRKCYGGIPHCEGCFIQPGKTLELSDKKNLIGVNLRRMRMERGTTQQGMAATCSARGWDLSRAGLSKIEAGIRRVNDAELLLLADILKVPMDNLFGLEPSASERGREAAANQALLVARHGREG